MAEQPLGNEPPNKRAKMDAFQPPDPTGEYARPNLGPHSTFGVDISPLEAGDGR